MIRIESPDVLVDAEEVVKRSQAILDRIREMKFAASTGLSEDDNYLLTALAAFYAGLALAAQATPLPVLLMLVGRFYHVMDGMDPDEIVERMRQETLMAGPAGKGKVM